MKILIVFRKKYGKSWDVVRKLNLKLEKIGHKTDLISREDDLGVHSLSGSMGSLKEHVKKKDAIKGYDIIYTQDWSIAFPFLIPNRVFENKHYCFFHDVEPEGQSKVFQKIVGNMMGKKLIVRTEELKRKFPKSTFSTDGIKKDLFEK